LTLFDICKSIPSASFVFYVAVGGCNIKHFLPTLEYSEYCHFIGIYRKLQINDLTDNKIIAYQ